MTATNEDLTLAQIRARIAGLSHAEKVQLAAQAKRIKEHRQEGATIIRKRAPQTDDELWEYIRAETGYEIPRVAVCEDHDAPFDFIADAYFERESALFLIGSRESGKTLGVSIVHFVNSETRPGTESLTFGAIEPQARRAYKHLKSFLYDEADNGDGTVTRTLRASIDGEPLRSETRWKNTSSMEIVVGSRSGVNSPHPQKVHADEVDLMDEEVWDESRSMSSGKKLRDGTWIKAQDFATSTRKSMTGLVQKLYKESDDALNKGLKPPWKFYTHCIIENAEEVPNCQRADPEARKARLTQLGLDPCSTCSCHLYAKGEWDEDVPRTFDSVCRGRFFRSRGWMPHEDVLRKFMANSQTVWDAQMECRRPMADGLYLPGWNRQRFCTVGWTPRPELGPIWMGVDWGGSALSFILWIQGPLRVPVAIAGAPHPDTGAERLVTVPRNAYVVFDEYFEADTGATKLADQVIAKEIAWRRQLANFRVLGRFADMAGKQQRDDWREHNPPLRTVWYLPNRDKEPMIKNLQDLVSDKRFWIDSRCARHMDDIEAWRQKNGREVHDDSSHSAAAARYALANCEAYERKRSHDSGNDVSPIIVQRGQTASPRVLSAPGVNDMRSELAWRRDLGGPVLGGRR